MASANPHPVHRERGAACFFVSDHRFYQSPTSDRKAAVSRSFFLDFAFCQSLPYMNASKTSIRNKTKANIQSILSDPVISKEADIVEQLEGLLQDLDDNEYRITVLGEFSSGKSTFLNAIIGQDILPHGVEETTAAVTYIHNVGHDSPKKNKVEVIFRDEKKPVEILDLDKSRSALIDYVTTKSRDKDVVSDIEAVHLYLPFLGSDEKIVVIDTPGLNGIKDGMRDITYREIHRSHANICLFNIKGASQSDVAFIEDFYKKGTPFFFVLNQIDNLKEIEETVEKRIMDFAKSIKDDVLHTPDEPANVFGVSALKALAARDGRIQRLYSDSRLLTSADRVMLLKESRIGMFESALLDFVKSGNIERNYLEQVNGRLMSVLAAANERAKEEVELLNAKVSNIPEKEILVKQQAQVEKGFEANKRIIRNKLGSQLGDLEKSTVSEVEKICTDIANGARGIVNNWTNLEIAESDTGQGRVAKYINDMLPRRREGLTDWLTPRLDDIYNRMVDVVRSFVPSVRYSRQDAKWNFCYDAMQVVDESKLDRINRDIKDMEAKIKEAQRKKVDSDNKKQMLKIKMDGTKRAIDQNEWDRKRAHNQHGSRPQYHTWWEERSVHKHTFFGLISYWGTESYPVDNQDEIDRWDREYDAIDRKYASQESNLRAVMANYEREKRHLDSVSYDSQIRLLGSQLNALNVRREHEKNEIATQRMNARNTRLKNLKAHANRFIDSSVTPPSGQLFLALKYDAENNINNAEEMMGVELERIYSNLVASFKRDVRILIEKIEKKMDIAAVGQRVGYLNSLSARLTDQIRKIKG